MTEKHLARETDEPKETIREKERWMQLCVVCQRRGHPVGDFQPRRCHFPRHGAAANEHMHTKVPAKILVFPAPKLH